MDSRRVALCHAASPLPPPAGRFGGRLFGVIQVEHGEALAAALARGDTALPEPDAKALLAAFGVPVPRGRLIESESELDAAIAVLSFPLVVKVVSPEVLHKSDAGGVRLDLRDVDAVRGALRDTAGLPGRTGWLVEEMAAPGVELMIGGSRHPRFGPMLAVGIGGVFVEYLDDVALGICPVTRDDAHTMLAGLRAGALLDGARGRAPVDREALVDAMLAVGGADGLLVRHAEAIAELDVNPLIAGPEGVCAVDARVLLDPLVPEPAREPVADLAPLLAPRAIAVAGASTGGKAQANQYIRNVRAFGFEGALYAVHPSASEVDGLPAYPGFDALPEIVDYAYVSVAAERCPALLAGAGGRVRFAQVMSGGFGEGGSDRGLEDALVDAAQAGGVRVVGPNCMGTHSPSGKVSYMSGVDPTPGHVSIVAQSGGLSTDILRRGARRGLAFRGLVTVGNCADVGPAELCEALIADDDTRVIGMYLEDPRRGRRLFEVLRDARAVKPVVLLVGGATEQGGRAARSHTGALAGDARAWQAFAEQTGAVLTGTLDEFLDVLLAMQVLAPRAAGATREVILLGNGGGTSVLAADAFARAGLVVPPSPPGLRAALEALGLPLGASVGNPIDIPANVLAREDGAIARRVADAIFAEARPDAFVVHVNVPVILGYRHADILGRLMDATVAAARAGTDGPHVVLVLRSDGEPEIEAMKAAMRSRALAAGIAVYGELNEAARALRGLAWHERVRSRRVR